MLSDQIVAPSVFILGAPKCGTTSLAWYLNSHPEIVAPKNKEPNFFSLDLPLQEVKNLDDYLQLFKRENATQKISFEASTWYLYSEVAVKEILDFDPESKFIVLIRNPVEMVQSLHSQQLYNLNETIVDFEQAWREQFKAYRKNQRLRQYKTCCETGTQLERLLETVDRSKIKLLLFDDLKADPEGAFLDVQEFIGLNEFKLSDYSPRNSNKELRFRRLQKFAKHTPKPIVLVLNSFKKLLGISRLGIFENVAKANEIEKSRKQIRAEFRAELIEEFSVEIQKLERIFERDLSHWRV